MKRCGHEIGQSFICYLIFSVRLTNSFLSTVLIGKFGKASTVLFLIFLLFSLFLLFIFLFIYLFIFIQALKRGSS